MKTKLHLGLFIGLLSVQGLALDCFSQSNRFIQLQSLLEKEEVGLRSETLTAGKTDSLKLESRTNSPRVGDRLVKERVVYVDPGQAGADVLWNFSRLTAAKKEEGEEENIYPLNYNSWDTKPLVGSDDHEHSFYCLSSDSLLLTGYENASDLVEFHTPQLLLTYPITYQKSTSNFFYGKGKYCDRLEHFLTGAVKTLVDGSGTIVLPGQDALSNVLRVHIRKKMVEDYQPVDISFDLRVPFDPFMASDTLIAGLEENGIIETDIYQWYAEGYRYPVLETIKTQRVSNGSKTLMSQTAFLFHPDLQQLLPEDPENAAIQEQKLKSSLSTGIPSMNLQAGISIYPNPVVNELTISMELQQRESVQIFLYDIQGKLLHKSQAKMTEGSFSEKVSMGSYPQGSYLIRVQVGEKSEKKVIVKQ